MNTLRLFGSLLLVAALPAHAGVIVVDDFDAVDWHAHFSYAFGWTSTDYLPSLPSSSAVAPVGVAGSQGLVLNADFSAIADPTATLVLGGGAIMLPANGQIISANPADYAVSLDYRAAGLLSPTIPMQLTIEFRRSAGSVLRLDRYSLTASDSYQHLGEDLSSWFVNDGSWAQLLADPSQVVQVQLMASFTSSAANYGLDADNSIVLDNLLVESIPEPGIASLIFTGLTAFILRRRL